MVGGILGNLQCRFLPFKMGGMLYSTYCLYKRHSGANCVNGLTMRYIGSLFVGGRVIALHTNYK